MSGPRSSHPIHPATTKLTLNSSPFPSSGPSLLSSSFTSSATLPSSINTTTATPHLVCSSSSSSSSLDPSPLSESIRTRRHRKKANVHDVVVERTIPNSTLSRSVEDEIVSKSSTGKKVEKKERGKGRTSSCTPALSSASALVVAASLCLSTWTEEFILRCQDCFPTNSSTKVDYHRDQHSIFENYDCLSSSACYWREEQNIRAFPSMVREISFTKESTCQSPNTSGVSSNFVNKMATAVNQKVQRDQTSISR